MINKTVSTQPKRRRQLFFLELARDGKDISAVRRYGLAIASVVLMGIIRYLLNPVLGEHAAFILFVPAILVSAWYGGIGPGILASAASLIMVDFLFITPRLHLGRLGSYQIVSGVIYIFSTLVVAALMSALRREQRRVIEESRQNLGRAQALQNEIVQREKVEQLLRDREEHLRLIFENARSMAIISYDIDGNINDWNEGAENVFGYKKAEIIGRHCREIFTPEDRAINMPEIELSEARANKTTGDDRWHLAKGDRRVYLSGVTCAKLDDHDQIVGYLKIARDNTEREKTEEALRESEWRFRKIFESAALGIVQVDPTGRFLNANKRFCDAVGYTLEELLAKTFFDITYPDNRAEIADLFRKLVSGEITLLESEKRCVCKNGSIRWSQITASFLRDELNNPVMSIAIVKDITEQKTSERKLRESVERLQLATESANIGLWHWDIDARTSEWSPIARQHLGHFTDVPANRQNFFDRLHPEDRERIEEFLVTCIHKDVFPELEYRVIWPDGSIHWIWAKGRLQPAHDEVGKVFIGVTMDITERKRAADQLQRSVSLFRTILESTDDGILVVDLDGKVVAYNQKFAHMWRIPEPILTQQDEDLMLELVVGQLNEPDHFIEKVRDLKRSDAEDRDQLEFKDGRVYERFSQPHRIDHEIVGRVWSFRDITDLSRARDEIVAHTEELEKRVSDRTEELEKALDDMETFLYAIAHDLRAPLRAMNSFVNLLTDEYASNLDSSARDYCSRISEASTRMNQLITDILNYGRLTHIELPARSVDLGVEVDRALARTSNEIEERRGSVQIDKPLPKVVADAPVLDQIIENLIINAMKFVPPDRDPHLHIYAEEHDDNIRLCLEDNGIGIAPENQSRIFGPFQRLHSAEEYPGTGIGLAIVRRGAEKMGGHVGVESVIGQGSRFWIELPKDRKFPIKISINSASSSAEKPKKK